MAINPLLSLQVEGVDLATPSANIGNAIVQRREDKKEAERQAKEDARFERQEARADRKMDMDEQQFAVTQERENRKLKMLESGFATEQELARLDIANKKLEGMSLREQARVESVIYGAAELGARLEAGDVAGAEQFLTQRRANLAQRRASGEAVDTAETDAALAAIRSGDPKQIEALKGQTKSLTQLGQLLGKLEVPKTPGAQEVVDADGNVSFVNQKPMPAAALKLQNEALDQLSTAANIQADLETIIGQIDDKKIDLGVFKNLTSAGKNAAGISTEQSRNFDTFRAILEKMRNDSLRLNKGVQTEGDAERAWNELLKNITDEKLVKERLREIQNINSRAFELKQLEVDNIRENYGQPQLDYSKYQKGSALGGAESDLSGLSDDEILGMLK